MTRSEHLTWAKARALAILDDPAEPSGTAIASLLSDLTKHPETAEHPGIRLITLGAFGGVYESREDLRREIEGFQ